MAQIFVLFIYVISISGSSFECSGSPRIRFGAMFSKISEPFFYFRYGKYEWPLIGELTKLQVSNQLVGSFSSFKFIFFRVWGRH